eukprot:gene17624-biopygen17832
MIWRAAQPNSRSALTPGDLHFPSTSMIRTSDDDVSVMVAGYTPGIFGVNTTGTTSGFFCTPFFLEPSPGASGASGASSFGEISFGPE